MRALPQTCEAGELAEWNGTNWVCGQDDVGARGGGGDPPQSNKTLPPDDFSRYKGLESFINIGSAVGGEQNVAFTSNPGQGRSGVCFGDSGGPHFVNNANVIVAVSSYVINQSCRGINFAFRTDTKISQDFVAAYLE